MLSYNRKCDRRRVLHFVNFHLHIYGFYLRCKFSVASLCFDESQANTWQVSVSSKVRAERFKSFVYKSNLPLSCSSSIKLYGRLPHQTDGFGIPQDVVHLVQRVAGQGVPGPFSNNGVELRRESKKGGGESGMLGTN